MAVARVGAGEEAAIRADAVIEHDPLAAAMLPLAAGRVAQRQLLDEEPVARFGDLRGAVERVAVEAAEHRVVTVPARGGAPSSHLRLDDGEVLPGVGMRAADECAADRREASGRKSLAHVRCQTAPDHVVEADLDLVVRRECGRRPRVEHRARPGEQRERLEMAGVRGAARARDVHEDHLRRDHRAVARGVVRARILVGVVAQVDDELVVGDLDGGAVDRAAVLLLLEAEPALRQVPERRQGDLLAVFHERPERGRERTVPVFLDELEDPPFADTRGRDSCPHVTLEELRQSAVALHDLDHRLERLSLRDQLHRWNPQPLLEDLLRLIGNRSRDHPADVVPVRDVRCPGDDLAAGEHGHRENDVVQMGHAAVEGIVRGEDVTRADLIARVHLDDPLYRLVEHADERRDACS